jgi:hypothetical protein
MILTWRAMRKTLASSFLSGQIFVRTKMQKLASFFCRFCTGKQILLRKDLRSFLGLLLSVRMGVLKPISFVRTDFPPSADSFFCPVCMCVSIVRGQIY